MKWSILTASRGRSQEYTRCAESIISLCSDPSKLELLCRLDDDDPTAKEYPVSKHISYLVGPRFRGYEDNPRFVDELAKVSTGDILMWIVDDAEVMTWNWDKIYEEATLKAHVPGIYVLYSDVFAQDGNSFPYSFWITSRKVYQLAGTFAPDHDASVDRVWAAFARHMGCGIHAPVKIIHHIMGCLPDRKDKTSLEGRVPFCEELDKNLVERQKIHDEIGRKYAELVRSRL